MVMMTKTTQWQQIIILQLFNRKWSYNDTSKHLKYVHLFTQVQHSDKLVLNTLSDVADIEHIFQLVGHIFSSWLSLLSVNFLKIQFLAYIKGSHYLCDKASHFSRVLPGPSFPQVYNPLHTLLLFSVLLPTLFKCHTFPFIPR